MSKPNKAQEVQAQVDEVTGIMKKNIDQVLVNQENLQSLESKTQDLSQEAQQFRKQATQLKKEMWWKNMKLNLIIFLVICVILAIIVGSICGTGACK
eukprot:TRINITY_DN1407_c0_g1_i1.p1 TRINITY_DN1407_c0_g1~~TRINITY_DN1407_c0_g1_i1.p1  ORF type:complete len:110 (-),score=25.11 TRINITY_DN1407_c0_g1_i1:37-327(-)